MNDEALLTIDEVAKYLQVSVFFVSKQIKRGNLPYIKLAGTRLTRVRKSDLEKFLNSRVRNDVQN